MSPENFFHFARERHKVFLLRQAGLPEPWTNDPVLQSVRFTNVFRELDRTTIWFRQNIRNKLKDEFWVVPATIIFRWFNRISTGEVLLDSAIGLLEGKFRAHQAEARIRHSIPNGPWVTGSYMVCSGHGTGDKLTGMLRYCTMMLEWWDMDGRHFFQRRPCLEEAHEFLVRTVEGLAGFTAYEVVSDLRWTYAVNPIDRNTWAHAGPGATRGGSRVLFREPDHLSQDSPADQETLRGLMRRLLSMSRDERYWPQENVDWPAWEMREVEHTLCEFDKYERVRREQGRAKNVFKPHLAGPLPPSGF